jgi:hypothetical protein
MACPVGSSRNFIMVRHAISCPLDFEGRHSVHMFMVRFENKLLAVSRSSGSIFEWNRLIGGFFHGCGGQADSSMRMKDNGGELP